MKTLLIFAGIPALFALTGIGAFSLGTKPEGTQQEPRLRAPSESISYTGTNLPISDSTYDIGTTTQAYREGWFDELCLTGDACRTSWPAGGGGGSGTDVNWTFFNNSGIRVSTTTNQVLIGDSSTSTTAELEVQGSAYVSGNIGIGTASPASKLDVWGTIAINNNGDLVFDEAGTAYVYNANSSGSLQLGTTGSADGIRISSTGNVGIGTTGPVAKLDVVGGNINLETDASGLSFIRSGFGSNIQGLFDVSVAHSLDLRAPDNIYVNLDSNNDQTTRAFIVSHNGTGAAGTELFRVQENGNVGIGTTSVDNLLHLYKSGSDYIKFENDGPGAVWGLKLTGSNDQDVAVFSANGGTGEIKIGSTYSTYFPTFYAGNSEVMRITTAGNVGIGTTTPGSLLSLNGIANFTTATSTFYGNGINLTDGCFAINGTCVSGGGGGGGDNVSIDGTGVTDPDFVSTGDIDFVDTSNTITANLNSGVIVNADVNASAAIDYSKLNLSASLIETDLDADVAAVDGDFLQYDSTGTNFTWRSGSEVLSDIGAEPTITADSLTHTDIADADQADTKCIWFENPTADDDFKSIWANKTANNFLLTEMWCESDQTVNMDLQVDDGFPADVNGSDLACTSSEAEDTSLSGDTTLAAGEELDLAITSVSGTPTWVSICFTGNWVD